MNEKQAISMLGALSQEMRLRIIRLLIERGDDGASAGDIATAIEAIPSKASFHLAALERAGLITSERQSRKIIYRMEFQEIGGLISFILNDCCGNHPDIRKCCDLSAPKC